MACFVRLSILYVRWKSARESEEFSPLLNLLMKENRVPTFTQIDHEEKENRTCETNNSAMNQKSKNINIDE